jgi:hypothetical protein
LFFPEGNAPEEIIGIAPRSADRRQSDPSRFIEVDGN